MNQSQALDDPWLRAHLPALDAAVTRRFVQLVIGIFEQRRLTPIAVVALVTPMRSAVHEQ
jgi:hypothetical protein